MSVSIYDALKKEDIMGRIIGIVLFVALALFIVGGTYFLGTAVWNTLRPSPQNVDPAILGLERLEDLFSGDGNAMLGVGLYLGALLIIVGEGLAQSRSKQDEHAAELEKQTRLLQYLAQQAKTKESLR
jgi:hypothetical protein